MLFIFRHYFVVALLIVSALDSSVFAQKNSFGLSVGMSNYGNQFLSPRYKNYHASQEGKSFDVGLTYTRLFVEKGGDLSIYVGTTNRTKQLLGDSLSHSLQQMFFSFQAVYHNPNITIAEDKLSLRVGTGIYWNMLAEELDEYLFESMDVKTGFSGEINNIGIMLDVPMDIHLNKHQKFFIGFQFQFDVVNSVANSHLFAWKPYIGIAYNF